MATTKRSDLIVPEVLEDAVQGAFAGVTALNDSGAGIVVQRGFPSSRGGDKINIPYFGSMGAFEDLARDEGGAGALPALTPDKLTMDDDVALVQHSGKAFETSEWARMAVAFADPYEEAARQMRELLKRRIDLALIEAAKASGVLLHNIYDAGGAATGKLTWDTTIDARYLWGDEQDDIALMVMHSDVAKALLKQKDSSGRPLYEQASFTRGVLTEVAGIPVRVSDKMTKTADYGGTGTSVDGYETLIVKRNALVFWMQGSPTVKADNDILTDAQVAALHVYWAAHRYRRPNGGTKTGVVQINHNL